MCMCVSACVRALEPINTLPSVFVLGTARGQLETTVAEEKQFNPRLTKDLDTFVDIMAHLNLAPPKFIGKLSSQRVRARASAFLMHTHSAHCALRVDDGDDGQPKRGVLRCTLLFVAFSIMLRTHWALNSRFTRRRRRRRRGVHYFILSNP